MPLLNVLAVEDNARERMLLKMALEALGRRATIVAGGAEALAMMRVRTFDVVLMDLVMPALNGFETARRIRQLATPSSHAPIAALTALGNPHLREEIAQAGIDTLLLKPINITQLAQTLTFLALGSIEPAETHNVHGEDEGDEPAHNKQRSHRTLDKGPARRPRLRPM
jgi:CheY-like chemotaxis protein